MRCYNRFFTLTPHKSEDWLILEVDEIQEQLSARSSGFTDHPSGDTFDGRVRETEKRIRLWRQTYDRR
jgi:hypothetical protein